MGYILTCHLIAYLSTFCYCYYQAYIGVYPLINLIILGWALFGLTSIGHEIYHMKNPSASMSVLGFFCLDLWSVSKKNWIDRHNKWHHYNVYETDEDEHMIDGSILANLWHTVKTLIMTYRLLEISVSNILIIIFRIWFFTRISIYALPVVYLVNNFCVTYFTFIAHCAPVIDPSDNVHLRQLHRSVDIFPGYWWVTFIMGAFNLHSTHHMYPDLTRDDMYDAHLELEDKYPKDIRIIDTWGQLYNLFKFKHIQFPDMATWKNKILY
jgi:fatty acid desaturase